MSDVYAIKETTLTALGDAVRSKVNPGLIILQEEFNVELSKANKDITISTHNSAPLYRYELINGTVDNPTIYNNFYIQDENDEYIYPASSIKPEHFPIILTTSSPLIDIRFSTSYSSVYCRFNVVITPLDENGNEYKYTPLEMVDAINGLDIVPPAVFNISNDASYRFAYNINNWLIDGYGAKITTNNITNAEYMFANSKALINIPFEINLAKDAPVKHMFENCYLLKEIPQVNIATITRHLDFTYVFSSCQMIREIPEWFINLIEEDYNLGGSNTTFGPWTSLFSSCYSLRAIPDRVMRSMKNNQMSGTYYGITYSKPFSFCYSLDELVNITADNYSFTSNQFNYFFNSLGRVKDITFETNEDGSAVVRPWKSQTIDLSSSLIGYTSAVSNIVSVRNNGITADKEVKDDTTYQALKNDPDWFSVDINYSRYNHDSAVRTINSLPDTSAYGTNIIKFKGASGALTDGGAINTLTEEEIAVASAKGWTVSLV